ncbi:MAG: VanW family protein [Thermomicrobiales bacterium]
MEHGLATEQRQQARHLLDVRLSRRELLRYGGGVVAGLTAVNTVLLGGFAAHTGSQQIRRDVRMAGIPLGGLTADTALARLTERTQAYLAGQLVLRTADDRAEWRGSPAALGLGFDLPAAVQAAVAVDGQGAAPLRYGHWLAGWLPWGGQELLLPVTLDTEQFKGLLQAWGPSIDQTPLDATFTTDGPVTVVPGQDGQTIAVEATEANLLMHAATLSMQPVTLAMRAVPPAITADMLATVQDQAAGLMQRTIRLRLDQRDWTLTSAQIRAALRYQRDGDQLLPVLAAEPLHAFFQKIAGEVSQPPVNARFGQDATGHYTIAPEQAGLVLDESATLDALTGALRAGAADAQVARRPQAAAIQAADLAPAYQRLDAILNTPLTVQFGDYTRQFSRADIQPLLVFTDQPEQPQKIAITLDPSKLAQLVSALAAQMNRDARTPQWRWQDGAIRAAQPGQDAWTVQEAPTQAALEQAILNATGQATPVVTVVKPEGDPFGGTPPVLPDRLGYGRTDYSFSIPSRRHNVELSVKRLDGTLIAPDAVFSFNQAVGAQTVANGYQEAYGIALVGGTGPGTGQVKTVNSIAGGICQVSTTLFQGAYHAGLPIVERNWHLYWITGYGPPSSPTGLQGLDATVDDQSGLDFKFQNATGQWLAIEAVADGDWVRIAMYGRDPGWTVTIDPPVITNVRPADPKPVIEKTHDLPPGQQLPIEHAVDGFDAVNHIVVKGKSGAVLRVVTVRSSYVPSQNVVQVGVPANEPTDS